MSSNPFDLLHADVWGPYKVETYNGFKYFLTLVDDYSRCTWVHLMKHKSSAFTVIQAFIKYVKNQFNINVKTIKIDNAFEMGSINEGIKFFQEQGIIHKKSCLNTPQQNGIVKRKHKHLLEVSRALLFQSGIGKEYWGECVLTASYTINRIPSKIINNSSPYEMLFKVKTNLNNLRSFGCLC